LPKNVKEELGVEEVEEELPVEKEPEVEKKEGEGEGDGDSEGEEEEAEKTEDEQPEEEVEKIEEVPDSELSDEERMLKLFSTSRFHILPSFFKTLIYLKKQKREFAIVLRGEGKMIEDAVFEFNQFCNGDHPCYCGKSGTPTIKFDGSKNNKRCDIVPASTGTFYNLESSKVLVLGTLK
jgi:hypothetical protein